VNDPALSQSILQNANELVTVFDRGGTIAFANDASRTVLGYEPSELVGRLVLDFVHPDDYERAVQTLYIAANFGASPGTTYFRLRGKDGSYESLEMTSGNVTWNGQPWLMTMSRPSGTRFALDSALRELLEDRPIAEVVSNVCGLFTWKRVDTKIAVAWQSIDGTWEWIGTPGCPDELSGVPLQAGSVWAEAIRTGKEAMADIPERMPPEMQALARKHDRGGYWINPVTGTPRPAVVSVWMAPTGFPPLFHSEGMSLSRRFLRLIMRWADQHERLDRAARFDELTGLPNRMSFFTALNASPHGAILYCDLDRFKPVNDEHGHAAGDEVLRQVARRLRDTVRAGDTVARIGGDEFAIICPASTAADAALLAARLRAAVEPPIAIGTNHVQVGISIGIAHTTDRLDAASVAAADRDLYAAKAARRDRHAGA
jgi:diguanylate cyclase (GGDEF)-like protein/PAS domain S-box-containing protein